MTAMDRPDNGQDAGRRGFLPLLVPVEGHAVVCGTCGALVLDNRNAISAHRDSHLASGRAGAGEQQRVVAVIEEALWQREQFTLDIPDEPGHRLAWAAGAGPFIRGLADELLALLGGPQPDGDDRQHRMDADCWCQPAQADNGAWDHNDGPTAPEPATPAPNA